MISDSHQAILAARAALNDAISRRDTEGIAAWFLPTYHVVTARSMQRDGRDASVKSWADMFARDKTATYDRTPEEVHINEAWGMAQEHGHWLGTLTAAQGPIEMKGVYAAKWQLTAEGWRLQAEIFTPIEVTVGGGTS